MQFEICEDGLSDKTYFNAVYREACELTAYYCKMYNLNPYGTVSYNGVQVPVILDHKTSCDLGLGSSHGDVQHWFKKHGKTLDDVRKDVASLMGMKENKVDTTIDGKYNKGEKVKLSANFSSSEFDCHGKGCCSETLVDQTLVNYLQKIRSHFGKAVNISSGYRCPVHNKNVGGATGSRHAKGQAADIYINGVAPAEIAKYAESIGIKGIGLYETNKDGHFVHIDTRTTKSFWYGQAQAPRSTFGGVEPEPQKPDTSKVDTSSIDPKVMWNFFKSKGLNDYGIAGLMGNLQAESGLKPINLQNTYESKLGMNDAEYTAAVDAGTYTNFVKDSAGYGLAQWTYWSLKQEMLDYHKKAGKSIGDGKTQMEFLCHQLSTSYKSVWQILQGADSVREASDAVLLKFERPADQSIKVQEKRAELGQKYYNQFHIEIVKPVEPEKNEPKFKAGDLVLLAEDAVYYSGKNVPSWVKKQAWYVKEDQVKDRVVISKSEDGKYDINSPVNEKYLSLKKAVAEKSELPYLVRITANRLNYRSGPSTNHKINGVVKKDQIFTIIEENGDWGKLKSGAGWINLGYTEKL
jgi:hypothetical protein